VIAHFVVTEDTRRPLIPIVARLPDDEQARLSEGGTVPLVVPQDGRGNYARREPTPCGDDAGAGPISVFGSGVIRSHGQQVLFLEESGRRRRRTPAPFLVKVGRLSSTRRRGCFLQGELIRWAEIDEASKHRPRASSRFAPGRSFRLRWPE